MNFQDIAEKNRAAWNDASNRHQIANQEELERNFATPGYLIFDQFELAHFERLPIKGKRVVQLPCNNGRELISFLNYGAAYGVGFDIADENIRWAKRLKELAGANCDFYRTNLLEIGPEFDAQFDFVYISEGSLYWFEDLKAYFGVVARLVKPGGMVMIHEQHPITNIFEHTYDDHRPIDFPRSYFDRGPVVEKSNLDYYGKTDYDAKLTYEFPYTLAGLFNSLIANQFEIVEFQEYAEDIVEGFAYLEKLKKFPLSYILKARRSDETRTVNSL